MASARVVLALAALCGVMVAAAQLGLAARGDEPAVPALQGADLGPEPFQGFSSLDDRFVSVQLGIPVLQIHVPTPPPVPTAPPLPTFEVQTPPPLPTLAPFGTPPDFPTPGPPG